MKKLVLFILIIAVASACKKKEEDPPEVYFSIASEDPYPTHYRFFSNVADYFANANIVASGTIPPNSTVKFRKADFPANDYTVELFNDDFSQTNWTPSWTIPSPTDKYKQDKLWINPRSQQELNTPWMCMTTIQRSRWLIKEKQQQTWVAIDAYDKNGRIWDQLTADRQFLKLTFRRDFRVVGQYRDNKLITDTTMQFRGDSTLSSNSSFLVGHIFYCRDTTLNGNASPSYTPDTITFKPKTYSTIYIMVKEN